MVWSSWQWASNTARTEGFSPIISASLCVREAEKPYISFSKPRSDQIPTTPVEPSTHHLDPDEMASDPDEMAAMYSTLTMVENLVEVKPAVAEMACERMMLFKWLLGSGLLGDEVVLAGLWVSMWVWWLKKCGLWLLGFDDFLVLNCLGLWLRDLMILLGLKMRIEFLFWAYDFFFELNFLGFFVCLFLKKISGDEPKEHEHVLQKKNNERNKIF